MNSFLNLLPVFEASQLLTSNQLNSMVDYLDQQNRITRVNLIGTGVICGFDLYKNSDSTQLTITKGMGVTSNGYLISLGDDRTATKYRSYSLPQGVRYTPFEDSSHAVDVTLYELLTEDVTVYPSDVTLSLSSTFLQDKVILLFLEVVDVDLQSCLGKACDEHGKQRNFNLRKLLISTADMNKINNRINTQTVPFADKFDYDSISHLPFLPDIFMLKPRFVFTSGSNTHLTSYTNFSQTFVGSLNAAVKPTGISATSDPLLQDLSYYVPRIFETLENTYTVFETLLAPVYGNTPFSGTDYNNLITSLTDFLSNTATPGGPDYFGVQYVYDFLRDLVNAYNEFRAYAFELLEECFLNMDSFPNHLMLTEFTAIESNDAPVYRQFQSASPLLNNQNIKADAAIFYHKKLVLMLNTFDFALVNDINNYNSSALLNPIRVTPSDEASTRLSKSAIPFYYDVNQIYTRTYSGKTYFTAKLIDFWDYNNKIKRLSETQGILPATYTNQDYSSGVKWINKTPLYYNNEGADSFRIEGHLGSKFDLVKTELETIKTDFGLPINILSLRLNGDSETDFSTTYNFDDLRTQYGALRKALLTQISNIKTAFPIISSSTTPDTYLPAFISSALGSYFKGDNEVGSISLLPFAVSGNSTSWSSLVESYNTDMEDMMAKLDFFTDGSTNGNIYLPYSLSAINIGYDSSGTPGTGFVQVYFDALNAVRKVKENYCQLLDLFNRNWNLQFNVQFYSVFTTYINEKINWLNAFMADTGFQNIILVYYKYQYRLKQIRDNDFGLFSNFVKKHPGIEHNASVKKGGTFLLLRNGGTTDLTLNGYVLKPEQIFADFSLPYLTTLEKGNNDIAFETSATALNIPPITPPLFYDYKLGDLAIAVNKNISARGGSGSLMAVSIDIIPQLICDSAITNNGQYIYLYLINENGERVSRGGTTPAADGEKSQITTSNYCNPKPIGGAVQITGTAKILRDGNLDYISYLPDNTNLFGVDSFSYMFEIVNAAGNVVAKSGIGQITMHVIFHQ